MVNRFQVRCPPGVSALLRPRKQIRRARFEYDVAAPPWRVVDQTPLVTATGAVCRYEDVARADDESLTVASREFECARERDDVLPLRCVMPFEGGMWRRFFEMDRHDIGALIQHQRAFEHMRGV